MSTTAIKSIYLFLFIMDLNKKNYFYVMIRKILITSWTKFLIDRNDVEQGIKKIDLYIFILT